MEIASQAEQFGLPEQHRDPAPPPEKIAEQLRPAPMWQGPARVETGE
jgi:hypothetical protein